MQSEAVRAGWLVGVDPAGRSEPRLPRVETRRDASSGRFAFAAVLALALFGAAVLATAVALVPSLYTPFF